MIQIDQQQSPNTPWSRVAKVISWSEMTINHFAHHIGLLRSENLYQIKRGNNGISRRLAEQIVSKFPQIDLVWLLTGSGYMLVGQQEGSSVGYFDLDVERSLAQIQGGTPNSNIVIPTPLDADFAAQYRGVVMGAALPTNSIVVLKAVGLDQIIPGNEYLIETNRITALRVVRTPVVGSADDVLRLVATMDELFDDIVISKSEVLSVHKVVAKLIVNN